MTHDEADFEIRRPDLLLARIARQLPFDRPRTLLALLHGRGSRQRLMGVTELWQEPPLDDQEQPRRVEQALDRLGHPRWEGFQRGQWPMLAGVVVRPGAVWFGQDELDLLQGLRYGCNGFSVLHGEVITVTPAGWMTWPDEAHGRAPSASWSRQPLEA